jgi:hypothetical protein
MGDVGFAAGAELAEVRLVGEAVGVADLLDLGRVKEAVEASAAARADTATRRPGVAAGFPIASGVRAPMPRI